MNDTLYIKIVDGELVDHPITELNLKLVNPEIDLTNTTEYIKFVRKAKPQIGIFQKFVSEDSRYEIVGDHAEDVWDVVDLTPEEKQQLIDEASESEKPYPSWILNTETLNWESPSPRPADASPDKVYYWSEAEVKWKAAPPRPTDGKPHRLNLETGLWEYIVE